MKSQSIVCHLVEEVGAGVNIQPIGFLVITENSAKMLPVNHCNAIDKLLDYVPDVLEKISEIWGGDKTYTYEFYEDEDGNCEGCCTCKHEEESEIDNENEE